MAERKSFLMRIDPALWADLEAWAQDELRSVNGQIEYVLKQAVAKLRGRLAGWRLSLKGGNRGRGSKFRQAATQAFLDGCVNFHREIGGELFLDGGQGLIDGLGDLLEGVRRE